ncbi:MAG: carboxypeptidase-like regulatory domain-containing protein [Collinsella aerofaciens]
MLDRRSLLVAGASSLVSIMLPRVPGTSNAFILPFTPTEAFADEEDPSRCSCSRAPCSAWWWSMSPNKMNPIAGAQVTLTSRYAAGKQLTATTDDEGTAIFEIAPLSEGYVDEATLLDAYDFNGGISISMPGYRDVEIPRAHPGGTAITAPTRPLSDGEPYFRQLTFDEWDIQYADATFMAMPKDDAANAQPDTHTFAVQAHPRRAGRQRCTSIR